MSGEVQDGFAAWMNMVTEQVSEAFRLSGEELRELAALGNEMVIEGMARVHRSQRHVADPDGKHPMCQPGLGPGRLPCTRCGNPIDRDNRGPCPAVPWDQRWSPVLDND